MQGQTQSMCTSQFVGREIALCQPNAATPCVGPGHRPQRGVGHAACTGVRLSHRWARRRNHTMEFASAAVRAGHNPRVQQGHVGCGQSATGSTAQP
jgi:hypothetical protein